MSSLGSAVSSLHSTSFRHLLQFLCSFPTSPALLSSAEVCAVDGWWLRGRRRPAFIHHGANGGELVSLSSLTEDHKRERGDSVAVWRAVGEQSVKALWWLPEFQGLLEELHSFKCGRMLLANIKLNDPLTNLLTLNHGYKQIKDKKISMNISITA